MHENDAHILGMSLLITTAFEPMGEVIRRLDESGVRKKVKVLVGGGVTTPQMVERMGLDGQTCDGYEGVRIAQALMSQLEEE